MMGSSDIPDFEARVGTLIRELNDLLRLNVREEHSNSLSLNAIRVLKAVHEAAKRDIELGRDEGWRGSDQSLQQRHEPGVAEPHAGALTWYELQKATRLSSDKLGLAINELLPRRLKTRDEGDIRYYFLPKRERILLQQRYVKHKNSRAA